MKSSVIIGVVLLALGSGCGGKVKAQTKFLKGASVAAASASAVKSARKIGPVATAATENGVYKISPDKAKVTFTRMDLFKDDGNANNADMTNCVLTYEKSAASGSELLQCDIELPTGTYVQASTTMSGNMEVLINDTVNGIYTDPASPTLLSTTEPAGGAAFVTVDAGPGYVTTAFFSSPWTVTEGASVYVITDMIHTLTVAAEDGTLSFGPIDGGSPPIEVTATLSSGGRSEFYTNLSSAENVFIPSSSDDDDTVVADNAPAGEQPEDDEEDDGEEDDGEDDGEGERNVFATAITDDSEVLVRVFYDESGNPLWLRTHGICEDGGCEAYPMSVETTPGKGDKEGGFLGQSGSTLAWVTGNNVWEAWNGIYSMDVVSDVGGTTTLNYLSTASPPAPASGNTYQSGVPSFTAEQTATLTLLAK